MTLGITRPAPPAAIHVPPPSCPRCGRGTKRTERFWHCDRCKVVTVATGGRPVTVRVDRLRGKAFPLQAGVWTELK